MKNSVACPPGILYNLWMRQYLETNVPWAKKIVKIQAEASVRQFYRLDDGDRTIVAMVYPAPCREEIERIVRLTDVYWQHGIPVPEIERVLDDRILLLRDLGDVSLQKAFRRHDKLWKQEALREVCAILATLRRIPTCNTGLLLGHERMKWEMDFFLEHFGGNFFPGAVDVENLRLRLYNMVERIEEISIFAHRDFHSRNMQVCDGRIYLVDFQDSMKAAPFYDTVSFVFDAYLDLGSLKEYFLRELEKHGIKVDHEQFYLTALQRNIKAMGTFGFQVAVKRHPAYKKYMPRTIRYILANPLAADFVPREIFVEALDGKMSPGAQNSPKP